MEKIISFDQIKEVLQKVKEYVDDKIFTFSIKYRDSKNQLVDHKVDIGDEIDLSGGVYYATTCQTATRVSNSLSITNGENEYTYNGSEGVTIEIPQAEIPSSFNKAITFNKSTYFNGMPHFNNNIHLCNNKGTAGGTIYFGDAVDSGGNPYVYIREVNDDTLEIKATRVVINGIDFNTMLRRLEALENQIGCDCDTCDDCDDCGEDCECCGEDCCDCGEDCCDCGEDCCDDCDFECCWEDYNGDGSECEYCDADGDGEADSQA